MWIREPVDPASIIRAYWTSRAEGRKGVVQWVVLSGSVSVSKDVGWVEDEGSEAVSSSRTASPLGLVGAGAGGAGSGCVSTSVPGGSR
jgi:hypothetical protein